MCDYSIKWTVVDDAKVLARNVFFGAPEDVALTAAIQLLLGGDCLAVAKCAQESEGAYVPFFPIVYINGVLVSDRSPGRMSKAARVALDKASQEAWDDYNVVMGGIMAWWLRRMILYQAGGSDVRKG